MAKEKRLIPSDPTDNLIYMCPDFADHDEINDFTKPGICLDCGAEKEIICK